MGLPTPTFKEEVKIGERFKFGANWRNFLKVLSIKRISAAEKSLLEMLELNSLDGKTFLDIGSGSGLFSLAARKLGAKVYSFDYDPDSVWCTKELKKRYFNKDKDWTIEQGSVLDTEYLKTLGKFDIVYSWGVLHHTGAMWQALENVNLCVGENGKLFLALYNYQRFFSKYWLITKKIYNKIKLSRPFLVLIHLVYPTVPSILLQFIQHKGSLRGMTIWFDLLDWLGGYPFEVSTPSQIFDFYKSRKYQLTKLKTVGGKLGCNEYVFQNIK